MKGGNVLWNVAIPLLLLKVRHEGPLNVEIQ
jgi:hypothetical protein